MALKRCSNCNGQVTELANYCMWCGDSGVASESDMHRNEDREVSCRVQFHFALLRNEQSLAAISEGRSLCYCPLCGEIIA